MTIFTKPTLFTTQTAADYLGLKISTLEAWRLQGRGPMYKKIGRLVRYTESDLLAYLRFPRFFVFQQVAFMLPVFASPDC